MVTIGNQYRNWTVLKYIGKGKNFIFYLCQCICGVQKNVSDRHLLKSKATGLGFVFLSLIATQLCMDITYFTHLGMRNAWWGIIGTFIGVGINYAVNWYYSK